MGDTLRILSGQFLANRHRLMAFITGITRDPNLAEDILQDCFLRIYERAHLIDNSLPLKPLGPFPPVTIVRQPRRCANRISSCSPKGPRGYWVMQPTSTPALRSMDANFPSPSSSSCSRWH